MPSKKYKIGDQVNDWKITGFDKSKLRLLYECICKCGKESKKYSYCFRKSPHCKACGQKKRHQRNPPKIKVSKCRHFFPGQDLGTCKIIESIGLRNGSKYFKMQCKCGKVFTGAPRKYKGNYSSCGCEKRKRRIAIASQKIGLKHGLLKVTKVLGFEGKHVIMELKCKCGNTLKRPNGNEFKSNSCGCDWHGKYKGESHAWAKLSTNDVLALRDLNVSGCYSKKELCKMYSISRAGLDMIINKERWKHV